MNHENLYVRFFLCGIVLGRISGASDFINIEYPQEAGTYSFHLNVQDVDGRNFSEPQEFSVTAAEAKGFIRVDPENSRYLSFENGESPHDVLQNVEAVFPDLQGEFQIEQWDTRKVGQISASTVTDKEQLRVMLTEFTGDIALKLRKTGTRVGSAEQPVHEFGLLPSYPNPFNGSTTLSVDHPQDEVVCDAF